jgi:hypothetical protein
MFAAAPLYPFLLLDDHSHGKVFGSDVGAVAEGLFLAQATGAPEIDPGFGIDLDGPETGDMG